MPSCSWTLFRYRRRHSKTKGTSSWHPGGRAQVGGKCDLAAGVQDLIELRLGRVGFRYPACRTVVSARRESVPAAPASVAPVVEAGRLQAFLLRCRFLMKPSVPRAKTNNAAVPGSGTVAAGVNPAELFHAITNVWDASMAPPLTAPA